MHKRPAPFVVWSVSTNGVTRGLSQGVLGKGAHYSIIVTQV